jgi:histone arginine demethylase JMJD6
MVIDRRESLSCEEFARDFMYGSRPVVIRDALQGWRALEQWTPEFFKREFGAMTFRIDSKEQGQANYETEGGRQFTMSEFIDLVAQSTDENPAPYFRNRVLRQEFPSLLADIQPLPPYFEPNWLPERFALKRVEHVLNRGSEIELYIGGKGGAFPVLHYDGAGTHAFLMQIYGRKKFIIYPPDQEPFLYPSPSRVNFSLINDVERPDLVRFPLFAKAVPITFILEPGELVFVPSHWWHTTKMLTPSITLSINTVNRSNWHELIEFVARNRGSHIAAAASRVYLTGAGAWRSCRDWGSAGWF